MPLDDTSNKLMRKVHQSGGEDNATLLGRKGEVMDTVRIAKAYKLDEAKYGPVSWIRRKKK
jgi:hypothetical protein